MMCMCMIHLYTIYVSADDISVDDLLMCRLYLYMICLSDVCNNSEGEKVESVRRVQHRALEAARWLG